MFDPTQQRKILVIDDNEVVLEVTRATLEAAGHRVVTHDRAAGCVALILQEKPDLVLMDVHMPHLSGDTIIGVLRKAQPGGETLMLLYSSLPTDVLKIKAESVGAHGFLQKTSDQFSLVREVNRWLKRASSSARLRAAVDVGSGERPVESSAAVSSRRGPAEASAAGNAVTVLLVDRDIAVLSTYRGYLQAEGFSVEYALSCNAALRSLVSERPPDVVVCEAITPDNTAAEIYRRAVGTSASYRHRIVLTREPQGPSGAHGLPDFRGQILSKPVAPDALRSAVRACLALAGAAPTPRAVIS